ncbi:MAG: polyisoprenoid-binding protein [Gemmatimonadales bacterium]|nr:MAG: polyisoprenoid-binding protein [Gemmatimonadales bacterium]
MSNATSNIGTWTLDASHSEVEFGVRHMMISTVKGSFSQVEGTIHLKEDDFGSSAVNVDIQVASISTGNADRDGHLKSADFLDVESFPLITFRSTSVEGEPGDFRVQGTLEIRGESRAVVLQGRELGRGTDPWGNPRVAFQADTIISRKDFGLTWNQALETGGVLVGDEVRISLEVQAIPASGD